MLHYYNDSDPYVCQWVRNLIAAGLVPDGIVDERPIEEINACDLKDFAQCHFFCGIAGWPEALRLAGWPIDRPVWTGSCPCQPVSGAGRRKGHADSRHVWPAFYRLVAECRPAVVFGEQVSGPLGREWLAGVRADLEAARYACGAADLCAASAGAPHIRQRLFWVADSQSGEAHAAAAKRLHTESSNGGANGGLGISNSAGVPLSQQVVLAEGIGETTTSPSAQTEKRGALNAVFVRWLMGYRVEWLSCADSATP